MENVRWGIIYCPSRGIHVAHKKWNAIRKYLNEKKQEFDFVQSEGRGSVQRLATMLARNGYRTIVVVGGDRDLNYALNGIIESGVDWRNEIELGVIPNGLLNDFARFWGLKEDNYRGAVDVLLEHRVRKIDVGVCSYTDRSGNGATRYFINCVNIGLTVGLQSLRQRKDRFRTMQVLSLFLSSLSLIFRRMTDRVKLRVNGTVIDKKVTTVCIGNALGYGQTPRGVPYNGMLDMTIVAHPEVKQIFKGLWLLFTGKFISAESVVPYRTRKVEVLELNTSKVSADGRILVGAKCPVEVKVMQECLNFIIPQ